MVGNTSHERICFSWILELADNTTTLLEMNELFTERHTGGIIFVFVLLFFGFFGNLIVIVIFSSKFIYSNYRTYTLWLASIDMVDCCLGLPFCLVYLTHYISFPSSCFCKFGRFVMVMTANASAFVLLFIARNRYQCVSQPIRNFSAIQHVTHVPCILCIILAIAVSCPSLFLFGDHTMDMLPYTVKGTRCWVADKYKGTAYLSMFYIILSIISFSVTITLIVVYSLILRNVYEGDRLFKQLASCHFTSECRGKTRHNRKTTMTLLAVTFAYLLSALPHNILVVILLLKEDLQCEASYAGGVIIYVFAWSIVVNNAVNPIIYGFSDQRFRKEVKKIGKTCWKKVHLAKHGNLNLIEYRLNTSTQQTVHIQLNTSTPHALNGIRYSQIQPDKSTQQTVT